MLTSYTGDISESPTDADFSGDSLFTKSFGSDISPPSTRNSTMQSFSQSSLVVEKPSEYPPTLPVIPNIMDEIPGDVPEEKFTGGGLASSNPVDALDPLRSTEIAVSVRLGSTHWHTPKDLLYDFWKVLALHVVESSEKLKNLPDNPVINELLSMTTETIAYTGLSAWKRIVDGSPPTTIAHLYALLHITYACAIVIFDGQVGSHMEGLFTHSLAIEAGALSDEDKSTYRKIVRSIWSPPFGEMHPHSSNSTELGVRPDRAPSSQSWTKGKAKSYPIDFNERLIRSLRVKEAPVSLKSHSNEENEILHVLAYFLDGECE
jgi:hypothetical protein